MTRRTRAAGALAAEAGSLVEAGVLLRGGLHEQAEAAARAVLETNAGSSPAWRLIAACREQRNDLAGALLCYEQALQITPDDPTLPNDLGRLAIALKHFDIAEKFLLRHLAALPGDPPAVNSLSTAYRLQGRYEEAIELLRGHIYADPQNAKFWNSLGGVLSDKGDMDQALVFFDEAIRLAPGSSQAIHNRSCCKLALGDPDGALADSDLALAGRNIAPGDEAAMRFFRAYILLTAGRLAEGWEVYECRTRPETPDATQFLFRGPRWSPADPVTGKRLLVAGEQGLGDEVMFAHALPDLLSDLGSDGQLLLAVEPRLAPLMQRSFPAATVFPHVTQLVNGVLLRHAPAAAAAPYDLWTPIGTLMRGYRPTLEAFPTTSAGYLRPDPLRVDHWRRTLADLGPQPKVGVLWKSLKMTGQRSRYFAPFEGWRPVLETPGVTFVNLQYGECAEEIAYARDAFGIELAQLPGIDLKDDLDDLAALCQALDLTVGPATATTNIAGAVGAPLWFISVPDAWPRFGTDHYPWYPQARAFSPASGYDWGKVMPEVAAALRAAFPAA